MLDHIPADPWASPSSASPAESQPSVEEPVSSLLPPAIQPSEKPIQPKGALHLTLSTLEQYLELPNGREERYHLLDGILFYQPYMVDKRHTLIQDFLKCMIQLWVVQNLRRVFWVSVYTEAHVVKACKNDPLREGGKEPESGLIADLAVGPYHSASEEKDLPNICFPSGTIPKLVIEVTSSSNLLADLLGKAIEYGRIKVPQYVIVDRDHQLVRVHYLEKPKKIVAGSSSSSGRASGERRTSTRIANALPPSKYPIYKYWRDFRGSEVVEAEYLQPMGMKAKDMLEPPCNGTDIHFASVKRARKHKREAKKAISYATILEDALKKSGQPIPEEALRLKEEGRPTGESPTSSTPSTPSSSSSPPSPARQRPRKA